MPKIKTNRAAAKRFKKTGSGKFKFRKSHASHILTKKTTKRKRGFRQDQVLDGVPQFRPATGDQGVKGVDVGKEGQDAI